MRHFKLEPEANTFEAIMVDVTHRCNMKCANCYLPNRTIPDMDKTRLYNLVERLPRRTYVRLIGAEPTMREDIFELISEIKARGHRVSLTTNGLKLSDPNYVKELRKAGLNLVLLSMNGADDNDVYEKIDNQRCAEKKLAALDNCMKENMVINTGTIIARGVNEHIIPRQVNLFSDYNHRVRPVLRFRTIGLIGRNLGSDFTYTPSEFESEIAFQLDLAPDFIQKNSMSIKNNTSGTVFAYKNIVVRLVNWEVDENGVPDPSNEKRGRITEDFKIAPFFEDVKQNEFGY